MAGTERSFGANILDLLAPYIDEEDVQYPEVTRLPRDVNIQGEEMLYDQLGPMQTEIPPTAIPDYGIPASTWHKADPFLGPRPGIPTDIPEPELQIQPSKVGKKVRKGKVRPRVKPTPSPAIVHPELGMAPRKEGYVWGIQPDKEHKSWWEKWFLGKGTPSKIPYVVPFALAIAGMDPSVNIGPAAAVYKMAHGVGQKRIERDVERAKEILQLAKEGHPISPWDRKLIMKYWPTMGQKKYYQVEVQYRQNPKTGEWIEEEQAFRKYGRTATSSWKNDSREESKLDWVMQPQSESWKTMQAYDTQQKLRGLEWRDFVKGMSPEEKKRLGKDGIARLQKNFMATGTHPQMNYQVVGNQLIGINPATGYLEVKYKVGPSQEDLLGLRAKYQVQVATAIERATRMVDYDPGNIRKTYRDAAKDIILQGNAKVKQFEDRVGVAMKRLGKVGDTEADMLAQEVEELLRQINAETTESLAALYAEFLDIIEDKKYKGMVLKEVTLPSLKRKPSPTGKGIDEEKAADLTRDYSAYSTIQ